MGNCLVLQEHVIKIVKPDGKVLEYRKPIEVQQVLSDFSDHAISDSLQAVRYLLPDMKLLGGHLYYLVPLPLPSPKKKVRFSIPEEEEGQGKKGNGVVRIKLVIRKQELQEMLLKEGVSFDDTVSKIQDEQRVEKLDMSSYEENQCKGWKPALESIPEGNSAE